MDLTTDTVMTHQRLDRWLVNARFVKTRSLAVALIEAGAVRINRQPAEKPHARLRPGDVLTIAPPGSPLARVRVIEVRATATQRGSASVARLLYHEHSE